MKRPPVVVDNVEYSNRTPEGRAKIAELQTAVIRMRNYGASMMTIADKLATSEEVASVLLADGLSEVMADDVDALRARQQATLNDMRRAMYPAAMNGDVPSTGMMLRVLGHESELRGLKAPTRVQIGLDQETFTTTVDEDVRALGVRTDTPLDDDDEGWSNT